MLRKKVFLGVTILLATLVLFGCQQKNEASNKDSEDYVVTIYAPYNASTEDCEQISKEVSKITESLIGCKVEVIRNVTVEQLNLALVSGEKLDLFYAFPWEVSLSSMASSNQIVDMTDLLQQYAPNTNKSISSDDWRCVTINGRIYGIPMNKDKAQGRGFLMVKEIADEVGIDYSQYLTYADLDKYFAKIKKAYPDMYPVVPNTGTMNRPAWSADVLGDSLGVLENCLVDDTTVVNLYNTDSFKEYASYIYKWAQEGYMMPDGVNTTEGYDIFISSGIGFGTFTPFKAGMEAEESRKCGKDIVIAKLYEPHSTTSMVNASWCIANNSTNPQKAMEVLELMYNNSDIANLLINGLEGVHWKFTDKEQGIIDYADGINASNTGYSVVGWAWPNEQITYVWKGDDPEVWNKLGEFNKSAHSSPAKGFVWNNEKVLNEVTACNNVIAKYEAGLVTGCLNPDTTIPKFNAELKTAGIDTIILEKQKQLNDWLSKQ
ncbi:ABC transporter substrate-binding protein [Spirochaeta cellobiosiphila]|uniref:ABC transporter substrate-binding protein n=1 Tax=Spirochaeta cellobiosiphila TaxID=504483 RepID=UPI0003F50DA8|nr:ABC transporter substrate-binding protein [Spirochaeta cellobiosiphila]